MPSFQITKIQTQQNVLCKLLTEIERNPTITQRSLARELGIALGLMNQYLKRCVTKGWIRASQISPRRITYFLTADGFKEKSLMVRDYLARSLNFFRMAKEECENILSVCTRAGYKKIGLLGHGDLAEITLLVASGLPLELQIIEQEAIDLMCFDAIIITDIINPQLAYETVQAHIEETKLYIPELLQVIRKVDKNIEARYEQ